MWSFDKNRFTALQSTSETTSVTFKARWARVGLGLYYTNFSTYKTRIRMLQQKLCSQPHHRAVKRFSRPKGRRIWEKSLNPDESSSDADETPNRGKTTVFPPVSLARKINLTSGETARAAAHTCTLDMTRVHGSLLHFCVKVCFYKCNTANHFDDFTQNYYFWSIGIQCTENWYTKGSKVALTTFVGTRRRIGRCLLCLLLPPIFGVSKVINSPSYLSSIWTSLSTNVDQRWWVTAFISAVQKS